MAGHARKHPPIPVIVVVILALAGGGWWWWHTATMPEPSASTALSGQVEARQYDVSSAIAGRLRSGGASEPPIPRRTPRLPTPFLPSL
jgi:multidrug resistance efflux pump